MPNNFAPIVLFVYNRPDHTRRTVEALLKNSFASESELFVFSDGPKREDDIPIVQEVRTYIQSIQGFKRVHIVLAETNRGLARSVIAGVSQVINHSGRVIVLEDDIITAPTFLAFMNAALDQYANSECIMQVSGYMFPVEVDTNADVYFLPYTSSWGWATWKRSWDRFNVNAEGWEKLFSDANLRYRFDLEGAMSYSQMLLNQMQGIIDSWAIRWYWSVFCAEGLVVFPKKSFVQNIGFDGSGTHCSGSESEVYSHGDLQWVAEHNISEWVWPEKIEKSINAHNSVVKFHAVRLVNDLNQKLRMHGNAISQLETEKHELQQRCESLEAKLEQALKMSTANSYNTDDAGIRQISAKDAITIFPNVSWGDHVQIIGTNNIQIGFGSCIADNVWLNVCVRDDKVRMNIGRCVLVGRQSMISTGGYLELGDYCVLAPRVYVSDADHGYADVRQPIMQQQPTLGRKVIVEENCWLGVNSVVSGNLTIGRGSVVAANAVVTKDVPPFCVVAGNPARIIKVFNVQTGLWQRVADDEEVSQLLLLRTQNPIPSRIQYNQLLHKNARIDRINPIVAGKGINI